MSFAGFCTTVAVTFGGGFLLGCIWTMRGIASFDEAADSETHAPAKDWQMHV